MKQAIKLASIAVVVITLASVALSQETRMYRDGGNWVQEMTGDLGAARNLRLKLASGSVKVQGGSQTSITYVIHRRAYTSSEQEARREFESYRMTALVKGDTAWIASESGGRDRRCSDDFVINVPRNLDVAKIETGGGSVNVTHISGRVDLETGGGGIEADDIGGPLSVETGGGTIDVGSVANNVTLSTGGGNIKIASAKGDIKAESGGGNLVVLSGLQGAVLETGGGSIRVDKCSGTLKATSGGGTVDLGEIGRYAAQIEAVDPEQARAAALLAPVRTPACVAAQPPLRVGVKPAPEQAIENRDEDRHYGDAQHDFREVALVGRLGDIGADAVGDDGMVLPLYVFGDDRGVPRAARGGDRARYVIGHDARNDDLPPP